MLIATLPRPERAEFGRGGPATGRIRSGFLGHDKVGSAMSRADIATFLVAQLTDTRYLWAVPAAISN